MNLVSLVIPTYNREDIIHETIESIQAQTYEHWEALCVDDGSTDRTVSTLLDFAGLDKRIKVFKRPSTQPKGANSCRNYGWQMAKGKYIKWVDSDDVVPKGALSEQLNIMESNPLLAACFGQGVFFNNGSRILEERWSRKLYPDDIHWDYIRNNVRWPIGGPLWRKDFFPSPPFHEGLMNSQEWLMHGQQILRLKPEQYTIIEDTVYLIRRGNLRMSSSRNASYYLNQARARYILLSESLRKPLSLRFKLELVKQVIIYYFHFLAKGLMRRSK